MKFRISILMTLSSTALYAQLNKQQTIEYIFNVYKDAYHNPYNPINVKPFEISVRYQTIIVKFPNFTTTYSFKETFSIFKMGDEKSGTTTWYIGKADKVLLGNISSEEDCNRLFKALLHLQTLLKNDKDSIDPFDQ